MGKDLAQRLRQSTTAASTEEKRDAKDAPSLVKQIQQMQSHFALAMPRGAEAAQLVRDALTCLRTTPKLAECEPQSVLGALMTCAQLGLRPGVPGLGHAWVLPFWDSRYVWLDAEGNQRKGGHRAQLIIGYQGYRELAQRSGQIATVIARVVHEHDHFDIDYGLADNLVHKPKLDGPRGEAVGYYAIVKYTSGGYAFWHMSKAEVEEHRDRYAMARKQVWRDGKKVAGETEIVGPWRDQFNEMAAKTVFLRLAKWMPKSTELASAIVADESVRVDLAPDPDALLHGEHPVADGNAVAVEAEVIEETPSTDEDQPLGDPGATVDQLHVLRDLLHACQVSTTNSTAVTLTQMAGRPIKALSDVTHAEAARIAAQLEKFAALDEPALALDAYLDSLTQTGEDN